MVIILQLLTTYFTFPPIESKEWPCWTKWQLLIVEKILAAKNDFVITKIIHFGGNSSASCDTLILNSTIDYKTSTKRLYDFILTHW